jgi:hypothetical protein
MWSRNFDGIMSEEFYDVILEIAAYAKKHLELGRKFKDKLPKNSHRAMLMAIEAEIFLNQLEEHNFDIFDPEFRRKSYFKIPYEIYKGAKNGYY